MLDCRDILRIGARYGLSKAGAKVAWDRTGKARPRARAENSDGPGWAVGWDR